MYYLCLIAIIALSYFVPIGLRAFSWIMKPPHSQRSYHNCFSQWVTALKVTIGQLVMVVFCHRGCFIREWIPKKRLSLKISFTGNGMCSGIVHVCKVWSVGMVELCFARMSA